jgi:hypothetical protein
MNRSERCRRSRRLRRPMISSSNTIAALPTNDLRTRATVETPVEDVCSVSQRPDQNAARRPPVIAITAEPSRLIAHRGDLLGGAPYLGRRGPAPRHRPAGGADRAERCVSRGGLARRSSSKMAPQTLATSRSCQAEHWRHTTPTGNMPTAPPPTQNLVPAGFCFARRCTQSRASKAEMPTIRPVRTSPNSGRSDDQNSIEAP